MTMTETRRISCDGCEVDLSTTSGSGDFRLTLAAESVPIRGGIVNAIMVHPPIDGTKHFCGLSCLRRWAEVR